MKAARWYGVRDVRVEEVPRPDPRAGELQVRVDYAGICASDFHEYSHGPILIPTKPHPLTGRCAPVTLGHEFTGTVVAVGDGVTRFKEGDRIVSESGVPCGHCPACYRGERILCREAAYLGFAADGAFAEHCNVLAVGCHKVPDQVSSFDAVIVEPLSVALHGVRQGQVRPGDTVAIVGSGTIGLCALLAARAGGASRIFALDKIAGKRALARQLGAEEAFDPAENVVERIQDATGGRGVDVAIECVGSTRAAALAVRCTRKKGRTVVIGYPVEEQPFSFLHVMLGEREVVGSAGFVDEFPMSLALLADGRINPRPLLTSQISLEDIVSKGFEVFNSPQNENIKIVVKPN